MEHCPDMYDAFTWHEAQREKEAARRQCCDECGEPIWEDFCYYIDGNYICKDCLDRYYMVETPCED